jgi:hypothetical protein
MPQSVYNFFTFSMPQLHLDLALPPIGHLYILASLLMVLISWQEEEIALMTKLDNI